MKSILRNARLAAIAQRVDSSRAVARQVRRSSTEPAKPVSPHVGFYKTFARPIAKVLLMATFTYQVAYWGWQYLEKEDIKKDRTAEIKALENQLGELTKEKGKAASA